MSAIRFNLRALGPLYRDALHHHEPTLAFEVTQGRGRFVFLMFFSEEDVESRDRLFVFLRNTRMLLQFKLYGNHVKGGTLIYIDSHQQAALINELQLGSSGETFQFEQFLDQLHAAFPVQLPLQKTLEKLRVIWPDVRNDLSSTVDQSKRTILIGIRHLPFGKMPKEKTLRKLYVYTNGDANDIRAMVAALKAARITLAWTDKPNAVAKSFADIMSDVRLARDLPRADD